MHYRFKGNPNTNSAGRLFQHNQRRIAAGLPPLKLAEWEGDKSGALTEASRVLPPLPTKQTRRMF